MNEWIKVEDKHPSSFWEYVLVTDGKLVYLGNWIENPRDWYGKELLEWDKKLQKEVPLDKEWHEPHWIFGIAECGVGPFIDGQGCFGQLEDITHWMPLPNPPRNEAVNEDVMENLIDSFDHLNKDEKEITKRIRKLLIKLKSVCEEEKDFNVILNALDLLREFYLNQIEGMKP